MRPMHAIYTAIEECLLRADGSQPQQPRWIDADRQGGLVVPRDKRACIHIHMDGKKTQVSKEIQRDTFNDCWMYLA